MVLLLLVDGCLKIGTLLLELMVPLCELFLMRVDGLLDVLELSSKVLNLLFLQHDCLLVLFFLL